MRLFKIKDIFYCEIRRGNKFTLRTKDKKEALAKYKIIQKELAMLDIYKAIFKELVKTKNLIDGHYNKIISMIENGNISQKLLSKEPIINTHFESELIMQETLIPIISYKYKLANIEQFIEVKNGIMDAVAYKDNLKIILEFKLGQIKEDHLGQCLRYLTDDIIKADALWLIGESINKNTKIFDYFKNILIFLAKKPLRGKWNIYPIRPEHRFVTNTRKSSPETLIK